MDFWEDLDLSIADLVRDVLLGRDVTYLAGRLRKSDDLLYKWANPNCEQLPSLKQFLQLLRISDYYWPLVKIMMAVRYVSVPKEGSAAEILRQVAAELEK